MGALRGLLGPDRAGAGLRPGASTRRSIPALRAAAPRRLPRPRRLSGGAGRARRPCASAGIRTAILSNGDAAMLDRAVASARLADHLDAVLSVETRPDLQDRIRPPTAIALDPLGGRRQGDVLFCSSNRWDVAGAAAFGFRPSGSTARGCPTSTRTWRPPSWSDPSTGCSDGRPAQPARNTALRCCAAPGGRRCPHGPERVAATGGNRGTGITGARFNRPTSGILNPPAVGSSSTRTGDVSRVLERFLHDDPRWGRSPRGNPGARGRRPGRRPRPDGRDRRRPRGRRRRRHGRRRPRQRREPAAAPAPEYRPRRVVVEEPETIVVRERRGPICHYERRKEWLGDGEFTYRRVEVCE